jgi:hypothetical protein
MDDLELGHLEIHEDERKPHFANLRPEGAIEGEVTFTVNGNNQPKEAMRFTDDKMRFDLLPIEGLIELTRVYDSGALKYDDNNWRKGMPWSKVYRPIFSHLFKWLSGQTIDKETGCHHLAMVAWNCLTLVVYQLHGLGKDDRIKFAIDDNFNWSDNHLGLGLSTDQKKELKEKYRKQRENAK